MTKKTWAALIGFFLVVSGSSAAFIYLTVKNKTVKSVSLSQVPDKKTLPTAVDRSTATLVTEEAHEAPMKPEEAATLPQGKNPPVSTTKADAVPASPKTSGEMRNILFAYHNSKAKAVYLIGGFNNWEKRAMTNKAKTWSTSLKLKPGTYEYQFIVDGKRIPDPNNKRISKDGKSLLVVKPLESQ